MFSLNIHYHHNNFEHIFIERHFVNSLSIVFCCDADGVADCRRSRRNNRRRRRSRRRRKSPENRHSGKRSLLTIKTLSL